VELLIAGLVLFFGVHSIAIVAPGLRGRAIALWGAGTWRAVYGAASLAGFVLLVYGFAAARRSPVLLYAPPHWMRFATMLLMLPAFPLLLSSFLPGRIKAAAKHPMLAAVKLWAFSHLLVNGTLADVLVFGGFLAWAVADRISLKRRPQTVAAAVPRAHYDLIVVVLGLALYGLFVGWAHARLFGVSPLG